ncbi:hypothetical protein KDA_06330 [Dictyobacter alpinus]|uniref:ABC transporter substrate-binding protein n=1 Tax=Dictyobacter alpinus TaxID=2014873 RepID=A0A402B1D7_9CHLR|nr:extracellular solute-binding protein [Dictyobacter alpinus]GCE25149.1 hypothetical protein KDA_06330 [Dictyobacter alpinus]
MRSTCFWRRMNVLGLLLLILTLMLSACGQSDSGNQPTKAGTNQPLTFSFYGNYDWLSFSKKWGQDNVSKWIQQNKKVTINFINSNGASKQKLSEMIAANDLPDSMMLDRGTDVDRLVQANMLVPLDSYLNKYPNVKKYIGEDTLNLLRAKDGHLYQIPNWYVQKGGATGQYWTAINTKIYKELGSPPLATYDDLESYLKLVKAHESGVIPLEMSAGGYIQLYPTFTEHRSLQNMYMFGNPEGNKLVSLYDDPAYLESMQYVSRLFREKLISQDLFTQTQDQIKEKANTGKIAVYLGWDGGDVLQAANSNLKSTFENPAYKVVWPFYKAGLNKDNVKPGTFSRLGWNVNVITKHAKDPEAIFAYLDWATGPEGQRVFTFGPPGLFWNKMNSDGTPILNATYAKADKNKLDTYGLGIYNTVGNTTFVDHSKLVTDSQLPPDQRSWTTAAQATIVYKATTDDTQFGYVQNDPNGDISVILQRIKDIDKLAQAKMVFAQSDGEVASILQKEKQDMKNAGLDKLLDFETQAWQKSLTSLNS